MAVTTTRNRVPIWVRVPGIIVAVLAGVFVSATVVGAADIGASQNHAPQSPATVTESGAPDTHGRPGGGHR